MKKLIFVLCLLLIPISVFGYTGTGSTTTGTTTDLSIPDIVNLGFDRTNGAWYIVFIGSQDVIAYQGGVWDVTSLLLPATFYLINSDGNILQINSRGELMGDTTAHIKNLPIDYPDAAVLGQLQAGTTIYPAGTWKSTVTVENFPTEFNVPESSAHVTNIVSVEDTNYVGKVSTGAMGLISGGGITTVTFNDTFIECAFTFLGTSGTVTCNFKGGPLTMRNGGSYKLKAPVPQSGLKAIFQTSDDGTVDYVSDELK